ncbi:MAG: hypothetical protein PSY14_03540 [bacterium]|nr:hypothetical protein [bacterium]
MKRIVMSLIVAAGLTGCAAENNVSIQQQLAGKSKQARVAALSDECQAVFSNSHVWRNNSVKYGKTSYKPHKREMRQLCQTMTQAASGQKIALSADQMLHNCLNEQVLGDKLYKSRNEKHIQRKDAVCKAFRAEL